MELTKEEQNAINTLHKLAKKWPESLWLFSGSGSLSVMKTDEDGERVYTAFGGVDQEYVVDTVDIPNDGGDW